MFSPPEVKHISGISGRVFWPLLEGGAAEGPSPREAWGASFSGCRDCRKRGPPSVGSPTWAGGPPDVGQAGQALWPPLMPSAGPKYPPWSIPHSLLQLPPSHPPTPNPDPQEMPSNTVRPCPAPLKIPHSGSHWHGRCPEPSCPSNHTSLLAQPPTLQEPGTILPQGLCMYRSHFQEHSDVCLCML